MMKQRAFLKMEGVAGTSNTAGHVGEIDVYKCVFVLNERQKEPVLEFKFIKKIDSTTPQLQMSISAGQKSKKGTLTIEKTEAGKVVQTDRIEMADLELISLQYGSLNYPIKNPGKDGPDEPSEVSQIHIEEVRLKIGTLVYPNVLAVLGANILTSLGLSVGRTN